MKEEILKNIKWRSVPIVPLGGQSCGTVSKKVALISEELDIEITVGYHRSQLKNKELAYILFELALDDLIKDF